MEENQKMKIGKIKELILKVNGQFVILDSDLANLYGYETKNLNRNFKNNISKFTSNDFYRLSNEDLRCMDITSKTYGGRRYPPYAFTEYGIKILSGILRKDNVFYMTEIILVAFE